MELVHGCKPQLNPNPHSQTFLQRAHSLYHRAYPASVVDSTDNIRTTPRRASLPRLPQAEAQSAMAFADFLTHGSGVKRTSSTTSRRSVKVMKNLLPLKLGSPQPQDDRSATPPPIQRSSFCARPRKQSETPPPMPWSKPSSPQTIAEASATTTPVQISSFTPREQRSATAPSVQRSSFTQDERSATPPPIRWSRSFTPREDRSVSTFLPVSMSTFELPVSSDSNCPSIFQRRAKNSFGELTRSSIKIRPQTYRDTPYYHEVGSPKQPDHAYYSYKDLCLSCSPTGSSCDETCIIHEYESSKEEDSSSDEDSNNGDDWYNGLAMKLRDSIITTPEDARSQGATSSNLSFKCRGESITSIASEASSLPDEASWLNSASMTPADSTPITSPIKRSTLERDMEGWLSDSSSCCDESDDILVRATLELKSFY
jgi:hypothetical protein